LNSVESCLRKTAPKGAPLEKQITSLLRSLIPYPREFKQEINYLAPNEDKVAPLHHCKRQY
jgi:hypothetical protein